MDTNVDTPVSLAVVCRGSLGTVGPPGEPYETRRFAGKTRTDGDAGGGTRTPDTRIMIPLL